MVVPLIVIGLILVIVGAVFGIWICYALGGIALIVGVILLLVDAAHSRGVR